MKKLFSTILVLGLLWSNTAQSENAPSLFGIELDSNVISYELLDCFNTKNIKGKLDSQGYLTQEKTKMIFLTTRFIFILKAKRFTVSLQFLDNRTMKLINVEIKMRYL